MIKNNIVKGAIILTIATIITKILGFIYRVYMSNIIGAEGMGLFQLIMPLYMLVWSISSSGFSTTISKIVSEENVKKQYGNSKLALNQCLIISTAISIFLSILLFILAEYIGSNIFKDDRTILAIKIMTISFPFMSAGSCIRGYFFGSQNATIPAVSQVLEQIAKMSVIFILSGIFLPLGLEYSAAIAVIGMCIGEFFSFLYVWLVHKKQNKNLPNIKHTIKKSKSYINIFKMSIPLTANRVSSSFLATIEHVLIPQKLKDFGYTDNQAISIFGQLSGMTMPLIMFPSALLTSLAISIIPAISEAMAINNIKSLNTTLSKTFLFTSIIGLGTAGLFVTFSSELGLAIYNQDDIGPQLLTMGLISPFIYFHVTISGVLNGIGAQFFIFISSLLSSIINILCIYFLTPIYGVNGFIIGYFLSLLIVNFLSLNKIYKVIKFNLNLYELFFVPFICITSSCLISKFIYTHMLIQFGEIFSLILAILILGLIYLFLLTILGLIKINELNFKIMKKKRI